MKFPFILLTSDSITAFPNLTASRSISIANYRSLALKPRVLPSRALTSQITHVKCVPIKSINWNIY